MIRGGWLIFDLPEAEMGCHPIEKGEAEGVPSGKPHITVSRGAKRRKPPVLSTGGFRLNGTLLL